MDKPKRLGRGLSSLLSVHTPVQVEPSQAIRGDGTTSLSVSTPPIAPSPSNPSSLGIEHLDVMAIVPNKFQPRRAFDESSIASLAASIKSTGLMQPLVVRPASNAADTPGSAWELIAGERRWRAAIQAGLKTVPAIIRDITDKEAAEWAIVENVQREDLNPIDKAIAFAQLIARFGMTHNQIAERVGLDRSTVANILRLNELEPPLQQLVSRGELSTGHAKVLLSMPLEDRVSVEQRARVILGDRAARGGWSVRTLESEVLLWQTREHDRIVNQPLETSSGGGAAIRGVELEGSTLAVLQDLGKKLSEKLGTKVKIVPRSGKRGKTAGRIVIEYYDLDHFDGVVARLGGV